jgi:hypothetical protein
MSLRKYSNASGQGLCKSGPGNTVVQGLQPLLRSNQNFPRSFCVEGQALTHITHFVLLGPSQHEQVHCAEHFWGQVLHAVGFDGLLVPIKKICGWILFCDGLEKGGVLMNRVVN